MRTAAIVAVALAAALSACSAEPTATPSETVAPRPAKPVTLTFGVSGEKELVDNYRQLATDYTRVAPNVTVKVKAWDDEGDLAAALRSGERLDVVLTPRSAIAGLAAAKQIAPVDDPLEDRDIDFGDSYSREAIEDFTVDRSLQCMPYSVSPTVVFVNTRLVDEEAMKAQSLPVPAIASDGTPKAWTLDQFAAAMTFATSHHHGVQGAYVDPSVRGLAPWLAGAGSTLFDDQDAPTRTSLSSPAGPVGDLVTALDEPGVRARTLGGSSPVDAFASGKLAAYAGTRADVPELRAVKGLQWEVRPMPGGKGTTGDFSGLCLGAHSVDRESAADFLAYLISKESVQAMARTGRFVPVNSAVGYSTLFTQPYAQPADARVFTDTVRYMQVLPHTEQVTRLQSVVGVPWRGLLESPDRAADLARHIDDLSTRVFPQPSPSAAP